MKLREQEILGIGDNQFDALDIAVDNVYYSAVRELEIDRRDIARDFHEVAQDYEMNRDNIAGWEAPFTPLRATGFYLMRKWAGPLFAAANASGNEEISETYKDLGTGFFDMGAVALNVGAALHLGVENQALELAKPYVEGLWGIERDKRLAVAFSEARKFLESHLPFLGEPYKDGRLMLDRRYHELVSQPVTIVPDIMVQGADYAMKVHSRVIGIAKQMFPDPKPVQYRITL